MKERRKHSEVVEPEYLIPPVFDQDGVQASAGIGVDGKEYGDPVPMAPPVGFAAPPDLMQMIKRMVRNEQLMAIADKEGFDTFEEAEDFEIEDDPLDPLTPYERVFEVPSPIQTEVAGVNGEKVGKQETGPSGHEQSKVNGSRDLGERPEGGVSSPPPVLQNSTASS